MSEVLRAWRDAIGGEEAVAAAAGLHLTGRLTTGGLEGPYELWARGDGCLRQSIALADVVRQEMTFDGEVATLRDRDGNVRAMSGAERADLVTAACLRSYSHLVDGRMPCVVSDQGPDEGGHRVFRIEPDGGKPVTVRLDPESNLPWREETTAADRVRILELGDWRTVGGLLLAHAWSESHGDERYDVQVTIDQVEITGTLADSLFAPLRSSLATTGLEGGTGPWTDVEIAGAHVFLTATVAGRPLAFLYDTGAGMSVIDRDRLADFGLVSRGTVETRGAGEAIQEAALVAGVELAVAGATLADRSLAALELTPLAAHLGRALDGIIGHDVISRFVTEIDYAGSRLRLHDPAHYAPPVDADVLPLELDGNHAYLEAVIELDDGDRIEGRFLVDTGADLALLLTTPFVRQHDLLARVRARVRRLGGGLGGHDLHEVGRIAAIELGDQRLSRPVVVFAQVESGATASPEFAGIVGGEILARFTIAFDYTGSRLVMVAGDNRTRPFDTDMSGLRLALSAGDDDVGDGGLIVQHVAESSPAAASRIEAGDRIVAVDGVAASAIDLTALRRSWRREGVTTRLEVEHAGTTRETTLMTRRLV